MLSILSLLREGEYIQAAVSILSKCFVVFCCLPLHELAHGLVADMLGDDTAKAQGRLTINPLAHLDPIGTIMIFLFGIGYARPVEINSRNFKKPKRDMTLTALAGPASNLVLGFVSVFISYLVSYIGDGSFADTLSLFFYYAAYVNVTLAVFNLLPIPPLDGSKVLAAVLPYKAYWKYMQYERYVMIAVMILLFTGILDGPITFLSNLMIMLISVIPSLIF